MTWKQLLVESWDEGLHTTRPANKLPLGSSPNIENMDIDRKPGLAITRRGFELAGGTNTLTKITFAMEYVKSDGTTEFLVSDSSRMLATADFRTWRVVKNTMTTTALPSGAQIAGKAWITNQADSVFTWDGTDAVPLDGTNGRPNVPRGKYIEYYHERPWVYNTTANASALHFAALSSTEGFAIAPDSLYAWPVQNQLNINDRDGKQGSGLSILNGQLRAHKENDATFTIFGTNESNYFARKTQSAKGTISNDSIAIVDNVEYYIAKNAVYADDGGDSVPVSDEIRPDIENVAANITRIIENTWETEQDFKTRGKVAGTTVTSAGFVVLLETQVVNNIDASPVYHELGKVSVGRSSHTGYIPLTITRMAQDNFYRGFISKIVFDTQLMGNVCGDTALIFKLRDTSTNRETVVLKEYPASVAPTSIGGNVVYFPSTMTITTNNILAGQIQLNVEWSTNTGSSPCDEAGAQMFLSSITFAGSGEVVFMSTAGTYTSEVTTITTITAWDLFNANSNPGMNGNVSFFIKTAVTAPFISTEPYASINAGNLINAPAAENRVQWTSSFTVTSTGSYPNLDNVEILHNEGGSSDARPIGIEHDGNYWLVVATNTSLSTRRIYKKNRSTSRKPNAWTRYGNINIGSLAKFNGNLYGGSTSSGVIYRLDYGDDDNGSPIVWYYETPEMTFEEIFFEKTLRELLIETLSDTSGSMTLGYSINNRAYVNNTVALVGGVRKLYSVMNLANAKGKYFKFRFSGNQPTELHTFGIFYDLQQTRQ